MTDSRELRRLARGVGLRIASRAELTLCRKRRGRGFVYETSEGARVRDPETLARLASLAVPPAYSHVRLAADARAHLQAVGTDDAGRLQYRYHPDWTRVREMLKARRLSALAEALPTIRRAVRRLLARPACDRRFALAAAVELVASTAIRAGSEQYAEQNGTRGATTLLKSHVRIENDTILLAFTGKGGKAIRKQVRDARLAGALARLKDLPGRRLFKYRDPTGTIHPVRTAEVNGFLKEISGQPISLKDFRTLTASLGVLHRLERLTPEASARGRNRQIREAVAPLADELANTLAVCRSSYVHDSIVTAFERGDLGSMGAHRSPAQRLSSLLRSTKCSSAA
ncbi:DNA topoisomerase IB [Ancylobacter sp. A5.8]|uniref:DNA topoisomerase IB n=1 Tax=Ancylobacter gelatini TaxID=2919920 RepID=UPI001F4D5946|nr:DNA topoisomerase IB [Ancylobacter gelatini]MCJ8142247.1 DNA topoisomerase IB [Ancylobacter gelatini]